MNPALFTRTERWDEREQLFPGWYQPAGGGRWQLVFSAQQYLSMPWTTAQKIVLSLPRNVVYHAQQM